MEKCRTEGADRRGGNRSTDAPRVRRTRTTGFQVDHPAPIDDPDDREFVGAVQRLKLEQIIQLVD
jgi:hypothetical protein